MNLSENYLSSNRSHLIRRRSLGWLSPLLVLFIGHFLTPAPCRAGQPDNEEPGAQVLTRGPVHEAFAGIVSYDPEPGVVVSKTPPDLIEEIPPEERPEGDNVAWIPGYWAWDDERDDFLWISGTWRALPPDREWMAGYWAQTPQGHQWISGYWADASATDTTYLPAPPTSVEAGPNLEAPSPDYNWTPGCWLWHRGHYAWRPGYWTQGRADWDWIPAHYVWTPRGYIFVEGYWDYSVERRGILFAPVFFETNFYSRRGYHYSPTIVISLSVFSDHLFLRPRYHHYYFGDYYASNYQRDGIYASFSFQLSRRGYDPFYSRERWIHRNDRAWEHQVAASYQYRREHETARPPRTWSAQIKVDSRTAESTQNRVQVAVSIDQLAKRRDGPVRFQPVARDERSQIVQRGQEVQRSREQRRSLEAKIGNPSAQAATAPSEPVQVQHPRSPIVAKPASRFGRNQAPPKMQEPPQPEAGVQPRVETPRRQPREDRNNPQPRRPAPEMKSKPVPSEAPPRERQRQPEQPANSSAQEKPPHDAREPEQKSRQNAERQSQAEAVSNQEEAKRHARNLDNKARQESEQRARDAAQKEQENTRRNDRERAQKAQQESEQRARAEEAQQRTREIEIRQRQEAEQNARASDQRIREESLRKTQAAERQADKETVRPERKAPPAEKDQARPARKEQRKEEKKKPSSSEDSPTP